MTKSPCGFSSVLVALCLASCGTDLPASHGGPAPDAGASSGSDPLNAAPICTSGQFYTANNDGSSIMHPGDACIACHSTQGREAPQFTIAGTVYPTGHEPNDCNGLGGAAQVVITDANSAVYTLTVNSVGNFYTTAAVAFPIEAKVVDNGQTRPMAVSQATGDCNTCHTQTGANGAPGRIVPL